MRRTVEAILNGKVKQNAALRFVLQAFSYLWTAGNVVHRETYNLTGCAKALDVEVVSVGNVSVGGSGKTPMTAFLAKASHRQGRRPMILTRGYGNDESILLQERLSTIDVPICTGSNRWRIGNQMLHNQPDIDLAILDDGFQHYALKRDLDIVMINALVGVQGSQSRVIPSGALREPWSGLSRADVVVLHHSNLVSESELTNLRSFVHQHAGRPVRIFHSAMAPTRVFAAESLQDCWKLEEERAAIASVVVYCGIANPQGFHKMVQHYFPNARVDLVSFPDHHRFTEEDMQHVFRVNQNACAFITTEKDWFRDKQAVQSLGSRSFVLCAELTLSNPSEYAGMESLFLSKLKQKGKQEQKGMMRNV